MRSAALLSLLLLTFTCLHPAAAPAREIETVEAPIEVVPGEIVVGWEEGGAKSATAAAAAVAAEHGLDVVPARGLERVGATLFRARDGRDSRALAREIARRPGVRYAEPNVVVRPASVPTDPYYAGVNDVATDMQRWAFGGLGQNRVLDAEAAWDVTTGDPSVVIAVIDSGVDLDNPEFQSVWVNTKEREGNNVDDDGNGYVDDVHGYDFHSRDGNVDPDLGDGIDNDFNDAADDSAPHGTIAASIVGAAHDGAGMAGGAPGCSLMVVKIFGDDGGVKTDVLVEAIEYAADNHADVINLSLSTPFKSDALGEAVRYAIDRNVVVVAAAGNGNGYTPQYPASFPFVIGVGGSGGGFASGLPSQNNDFGRVDGRWPKSQFGLAVVSVVAPAAVFSSSVVTVAKQNEDPSLGLGDTFYGIFEGTSFATPYVSALAGLVISQDKALFGRRTLAPVDVKTLLEKTAVDLPADYSNHGRSGPVWDGSGRVDYAAALRGAPGGAAPSPVVTAAKHYQKKYLRIFGDGFSADSQIEVNGRLVTLPITFSYTDGLLEVVGKKKELGLGKKRTNHIVVIERGVRSAEFVH
jgi:subtilisin family serine protease